MKHLTQSEYQSLPEQEQCNWKEQWQFYKPFRHDGINPTGWLPCTDNNPQYAREFGLSTLLIYIPITPNLAETLFNAEMPVEEQLPKEITKRKTDLGLSNNIEPCPFCGGAEGEQVFLGRTEPDHYQITCICCSVKMKHDRKDKVIGIWNNRKPLSDFN